MKLKKLVQYGLMAVCLLGNAIAMEEADVLVIGCRPWDKNVEGFQGLNTAHFVDFQIQGAPAEVPAKFHHLDINNKGVNGGGNFSDFATTNLGKFKTIIIDWITYQHIHRETAWADFASLLNLDGKLIVPVTKQNTSGSLSKQTAQEIIDNQLRALFSTIEILTYETLPNDSSFDLLRRPSLESGRLEYGTLPMIPAIIVAIK